MYKFEQVMINCPSAGMEQWFLCNKWLATGEGDGLIERDLYEAVSMRKIRKKREYLNCITCTFPRKCDFILLFHKHFTYKIYYIGINNLVSTWHVWVYTSDMRGAGTDANVHLIAYGKNKNGEYKKSNEVVLDNKVCFCS